MQIGRHDATEIFSSNRKTNPGTTSTCTCEAVETLVPPATFSFSSANRRELLCLALRANQGGVCSEESGEAEMRSSAEKRRKKIDLVQRQGGDGDTGRWRGRGDGDEEKKKSFYDSSFFRSEQRRRTAKSDVGSVEECSKLEFTKDEVFALLSERAKAGSLILRVRLSR
ncbi:hypothetical protein Bca4012_025710 [Brassica carinata]